MTKEIFLMQLDRAVLTMKTKPVTGALLKHISEVLRKGDPRWWPDVLRAWEKRSLATGGEAWSLFLSCVHFEAVNDADNILAPYFPSCGGACKAGLAEAFDEFMRAPPDGFFERLRIGRRRGYVALRAPLWISPALLFFQRKRRLPFYLVEINAGAGLNLAADAARRQKGFDSGLVAARIGLDSPPLELSDIAHWRWLIASIMPDDMQNIIAMEKARGIVLAQRSRDPAFIQLVPCAAELAPQFIAKNIPVDDDVGLMILNTDTTAHMTDPEYARFKLAIRGIMRPWGDRALWVEIEPIRHDVYSEIYQLRTHRLQNEVLQGHAMVSIDPGATRVYRDINASAKFLAQSACR